MKRLVAASAATLALTACSSSSSPAPQTTAAVTTQAAVTTATTTTSPALTPAQFITKLNALCRAGNKQQRKANQAATTKAELAVKVNREIEQLAPPAEDSAAFKRYTTALDRLAGIMSRVADLLNTGTDFSGLSSLLDQVDRSRVQAAIDLGADDCGQV